MQHSLDKLRYQAHQPEVIELWFKKLMAICEKYNIHLDEILNMDETGFQMGVGESRKWLPEAHDNVAMPPALQTVTT